MSTVALGIAPDDDGNGVTPMMHRLCQMAQWETTGVLWGLEVTANDDLSYTIAPGVAITSRGDDDGYAVAYFEGGDVDTTDGGSDTRWDIVQLASHDHLLGDADNLVTASVVHGEEGGDVPEPDEGAVVLDTFSVPAGAASASEGASTGEVKYASPTKSFCGLLGEHESTSTTTVSTSTTTRCTVDFHVPTRRSIRVTVEAAPYLEAVDETCLPLSSCVYSYIQLMASDEGEYTTYSDDGDAFRVAYPAEGGYYSRTTIVDRTFTVDEGYWTLRWRTKAMSDDYATVKLHDGYTLKVHDLGIAEDEDEE